MTKLTILNSHNYLPTGFCWIFTNPYGEAVLILVLFRVLFLVSNEAKECSTPNSTPLVGVLFVVLHSNGVLFVVFSFKSFGVLKTVPFGVRQLFKLALRLALDTSLICMSLVLNGVLKAVPNGVLNGVLFAVLLQTECCLWCIASSPLETGVLKAVPNGVLKGVLKAVPVPTGSINFQIY